MSLYTITLTDQQLYLLSNACELIARIEMNQLDMVPDWIMQRLNNDDCDEVLERFRAIQGYISTLQLTPRSSDSQGELAWDLYQIFRHRLAWDRAIASGIVKEGEPRKWPDMMTVNYDEPMQRHTERLAQVEKVFAPLTNDDILDFWLRDEVDQKETQDFLHKIKHLGFVTSVDQRLVMALIQWSKATPGKDAGKYAKAVRLLVKKIK